MPPDTSHREISADLLGKEKEGKKGKMEKKRRKIEKGKVKNCKRKLQNEERTFFLLLFFFFFFALHFSKPLKFVLGLP